MCKVDHGLTELSQFAKRVCFFLSQACNEVLQRIPARRIKGEGSLRGGSKTLTPTVTHKDPAGITSILDGAVVDFRAFKVHVFGKSANHHKSTFPAPEGDNLSYGPKFLEQL